ncbi:hypothetical protein [Lactiplantibacillus plantarum]|uniref:hypothetical protein n=1 Tax=Lactiplantibacillus plantarum TaxID=1590 RepID=UPI0001E59095|nr:hypothetical protein [Lactiplantibacillus plantarum]ADN99259.1 hypothetical protein LPST_C2044 [Lactiplantibacillus plantarum ST-III]KZD90548.1 hypothetical protein FBR5_2965 [Lactiplantibacillus plantarum]MDO7840554.1 hypothetical protein [Lactiplantibacillus plantarum]UYF39826.1 hypothetical protein LTG66_10505 [Lactiplantibacillus plantarum]
MKKGITIGAVLFTSLALAACGNSANKSSESNPKSSSLVTAKRKKASSLSEIKKKAYSESKVKASSESSAKAKSESESIASSQKLADSISESKASSESIAATSSSSAASSASQSLESSTAASSATGANSESISMDEHTLTGFLNKYGVSPVLYKIQHGMSEKEAFETTPDSMKSSGELQTQFLKYGIK